MYWCESWTIKKAERQKIDAFEWWCQRRPLRVPWTPKSNQLILKEIKPGTSLEGLRLKLKLQYFGHLIQSQLIGKDPDTGKDWRQKKRVTGTKMVGWHHQFNENELGQTQGDGEGQEGLVCHSPWGHKESDTTWWLNTCMRKVPSIKYDVLSRTNIRIRCTWVCPLVPQITNYVNLGMLVKLFSLSFSIY